MYQSGKHQNAESNTRHSAISSPYSSHKNPKKNNKDVVCIECGALKHNGKWTWDTLPNKFEDDYCPACLRIRNDAPAGSITLSGMFVKDNRDELVYFITSIAAEETSRHPLERLMNIEECKDQILVKTTGVIMPRHIGYALNLRFHGTLETVSGSDGDFIQFLWKRDA